MWARPPFPTGGQEFLVIWLHVWVCWVGLLCFLVLHVRLLSVFPQHSEEISGNRSRVQGLMEAGLSELHWHPGCSLLRCDVETGGPGRLQCGLEWEMQKLCVLSIDIKVQVPYPFFLESVTLCQHNRKLFLEEVVCSLTNPYRTLPRQWFCSVTNISCFCRFRFDIV